ncbi:DNA cytosine methyltransferase [Cupriavidus oxalaticus]|uniref:DNA (cytosine-5-)-methyltransferase n=1 Tax=Cupriavidus oxalaticus TaxID=96344 RepID=A0A375GF04_9BURK|nr:DNA cytosine methyltransferase [Cupriavidus oxalaticus]QRQ86276.1 DNA cytosine methyltransferase [Cupriavidus oxalaticus]QRQ95397.1 DNA cytosine methyltransferase [Cupriavidus oxalaticus]WQD84053.1 DNA cytosine methyltransferase [Cupriavidus oxalaticus]SPC17366.1 DNA methyltransferase [Cupriavidus oxalaticus]
MIRDQFLLDISEEIIVDNFAGGGGASCGIELALGRHVDIAINHDPEAVAMHAMNHPQTEHHCESVWDVDPLDLVKGRPVGLAWFSPDCKHFSKAKGGKPRDKKIRGLAWVAMRWAALVRPRVIILENVEEFQTWGPLLDDGNPCPKRKGDTFRSFVRQLNEKGYAVEWRELRACDFGAPTIRKRLFLIARCDGKPIVWPEPTHGAPGSTAVKAKQRKPWRTAAECIDWSIPCPSIFERPRPLAEATQRRIARGLRRYVIDAAAPYTVRLPAATMAPIVTECANASSQRAFRADEPLRTQCAEVKGGHFALASATLIQTGYGERAGQAPRAPGLDKPLGTVVAGGAKHALVSAFLAKHYGGNYDGPGVGLNEPASTITTADHHALVSSNLVRLRGECTGSPTDVPTPTVTAGGTHIGEVRAFLVKYYSEGGQDQDCRDPMHTIPTKDRLGLVTVAGEQYQIADIGMRMLEPHELYAAQGFPASYVIAPVINGRRLPKHAQVRMCGNSVSPPMAAALVHANVPDMASWPAREAKRMGVAA